MTTYRNTGDIVNLTPHEVRLVDEDGATVLVIPPTGQVARLSEAVGSEETMFVDGLWPVRTRAVIYDGVEDLPDAGDDHMVYIVSREAASACTGRADVYFPGGEVRDDHGRIVGCRRLDTFG